MYLTHLKNAVTYSNPRIICEFLTPEPRVRGGLGWGKKFTTPARIAISGYIGFVTIDAMDFRKAFFGVDDMAK